MVRSDLRRRSVPEPCSDFDAVSVNISKCRKCGATWIDGQLHWATGKPAKEADLAGLVCNNLGDENCINPARGDESGSSWEKRLKSIDKLDEEFER